MAVNPTVMLYTEEVLHAPCEEVKEITEDIFELVGKLLLGMKMYNGIGLSANQIGVSKRVCVASLENNTKQMAFVNPKITHISKKKKKLAEGCLSAPRFFTVIKRPDEIIIECLNLKGEKCEYHMTGMDARILQHEIQHLNGGMITDKMFKFKK